jgi:hypothetical protein
MSPLAGRGVCSAALVLFLALVSSGCDVLYSPGAIRIDFEGSWTPDGAPPAEVGLFWFDDADDVLGVSDIEATVRDVSSERSGRPSSGVNQTQWRVVQPDAEGRAVSGISLFYAGALFTPLRRLLFGKREHDPDGFVLRVSPNPGPAATGDGTTYFVVREDGDGFGVFGLVNSEEGVRLGPVHGSVTVAKGAVRPDPLWRIVLNRRGADPEEPAR